MLLEAVLLAGAAAALAYWWIRCRMDYWRKMGVPEPTYPPTHPIFGNATPTCREVSAKRTSEMDVAKRQHSEMRGRKVGPVYGVYSILGSPVLVVRDLDIVKRVLVADSASHFRDRFGEDLHRIIDSDNLVDRIMSKLFIFARGEEWKRQRATFSPVFTSGRLRAMTAHISAVADRLVEHVERIGPNVELRDTMGRVSMDTIASCAFGIDARSLGAEGESVFVRQAKGIHRRPGAKFLISLIPGGRKLLSRLGMSPHSVENINFMFESIRKTVEHRASTGDRRNDLVDLMVDALKEENPSKQLDLTSVVATAITVMVAGYDTSGLSLAYAGHALATHPDVQRRLQAEIDSVLEKGEMDFETAVYGMEYMDMFVSELLRRYGAFPTIMRDCTKDWAVPGRPDVVIRRGQAVLVNVAGIHMDPDNYPEPEKFDPERFSKEGKASRHPYAFLGFGHGPRSCLGMRFALLEVKMVLAALLSKYDFVRCERTDDEIAYDPTNVLATCRDPIWVRFEKRA